MKLGGFWLSNPHLCADRDVLIFNSYVTADVKVNIYI